MEEEFYMACFRGEIQEVRRLHGEGAPLNQPDEEGDTPLLAASMGGRAGVVSFLLKEGADVAHRNEEGKSALHLCLEEYRPSSDSKGEEEYDSPDHHAVMKLLLNGGVDVNATDLSGKSAAHYLADRTITILHRMEPEDAVGLFRELLVCGLDLMVKDESGFTAYDRLFLLTEANSELKKELEGLLVFLRKWMKESPEEEL